MNTKKFLDNFEDISTSLLEQLKLACWVEIVTDKPDCIYYFGPFACASEAQKAQPGYIEDLEQEQAQITSIKLKRYQPKELTVFADELGLQA